MSSWTQFFREAGIPSSAAKSYAGIFEDNRITRDMLLDLSKEILTDMGIRVMGDIICILKHAKKEVRMKERISSDTGPVSLVGVPTPLAHSTTPGHPDAVSTTSPPGRKSKTFSSSVSPTDNWGNRITPPNTFVSFGGTDQGVLELESDRLTKPTGLRSDQILFDSNVLRQANPNYYMKKNVEPSGQLQFGTHQHGEEYTTLAYERSMQQKRPATMYSDEVQESSPNKQPRVVVLPGERGQEMYTTTALQRAAAIAAATAIVTQVSQGKTFTEQSNKQILEEAELSYAPSGREKVTSSSSSVFSRLDSNRPSSSSFLSSPPHPATGIKVQLRTPSPPPTRVAADAPKVKIIKLARESKVARFSEKPSKPKTIVSSSASDLKVSSIMKKSSLPGRVSDRLGGKERPRSSTVPNLTKKVITRASTSTTSSLKTTRLTDRLGSKEKPVLLRSSAALGHQSGESTGNRGASAGKSTSLRSRLGEKGRVQVSSSSSNITSSSTRKLSTGKEKETPKLSMVADEYDYQTRRQMDIRSRLERKEKEKVARRSGPLVGRLEKHHIFQRLE